MIPASFKRLAALIINSWKKKRSNYVIISPPMSDSHLFFKLLNDRQVINEILKDHSELLCIAVLDTSDFKTEIAFAHKVCTSWGINDNDLNLNDPTEMLYTAIQQVVDQGMTPILIIKRFHEALKKLGEDIGTTLRNLEHEFNLKTVVELPVSITSLRTRWEQDNRTGAPFLASDWGQGHTHKILKGYDLDEIKKVTNDNCLNENLVTPILKMTGGLHSVVENLVQDLEKVNEKSFDNFCMSRAPDLCRSLTDWFEGSNSTYYKQALVDYYDGIDPHKNMSILGSHDWSEIIINKQNDLCFRMLTFQSRTLLNRHKGTVGDTDRIKTLLEKGNYIKLEQFFAEKISEGIDKKINYEYCLELARLCRSLSDIYNNSPNWNDIKKIINKISSLDASATKELDPYISVWEDISILLSDFFEDQKTRTSLRIEQFVCEKYESRLPAFLLLLEARLKDANNHDPYYALQAVISHPESLLQSYCFVKFGLKFWQFEGLDLNNNEISVFIKRPYDMPKISYTLGFADLLFMSTYLSNKMEVKDVLVNSFEEMEKYLNKYETRKKQVHSTAFIHRSEWSDYNSFCLKMINKIRVCLGYKSSQNLILPRDIFEHYLESK